MNDRRHKRRLAAIVAADVVGYARLMSRDEDGTVDAIRDVRAALVEPMAAEGGGFLLEFPSAADAVEFAVSFQSRMATRGPGAAPEPLVYRIGVNISDVIPDDDGDIFGDGVNIAARLEGIADPGGVCISDDVLRQIAGKVEITADDLGPRALKNVDAPVRAHRVRSGPAAPSTSAATRAEEAIPLPRERPSLAVLPFRSLSADPDAAFIADGISLGLQTLLVQLSNLFFVNACLHTGYREGRQTAAEALAEMPVRYAVEGAVRQAGDRARLRVQLSDLSNGAVLWAETYDHDLSDIFALEDEIARRIAGALSAKIIGGHVARDFTGGLDSPEAWELFLRGINHFYRWTAADCAASLGYFNRLAEVCPESAIAPNYVAVLHYMSAVRGWVEDKAAAFGEAQRWSERAMTKSEGANGLAHAVLGSIALSERRHDEALLLCREAVAFRSNCPFAIGQYGAALTFSGDPLRGAKRVREAMSVRMAQPSALMNLLAVAYRDRGEIDLSIPAAREAERIEPGFIDALATLCTDFALQRDATAAATTVGRLMEADPSFSARAYAARQPYRDKAAMEKVAAALLESGAPA